MATADTDDGADFEFDFDLLRELTETGGVPGYEDRIRDIVRRELAETTDRVRSDAMGNVVGTLEGESDYEVAVPAHMDEIGFMVRHVDSEGFLELDPLGGWDPRVLKAQRVTIHTANGQVPGVIGSVPPHTLDETDVESTPAVEDVYVDLGLPTDDEGRDAYPESFPDDGYLGEYISEIARKLYDDGYSVRGLYARLTEDAALNPDTLEERYHQRA